MQHFGSRGHCWVRRIKELCWLKLWFIARISNNVHRYTNVELTEMHFIYRAVQRNGSHLTTLNSSRSCRRTIFYCALYCFFHCMNYAIFSNARITPPKLKWFTHCQVMVKTLKCLEIQQIPNLESFHVHPLKTRFISLCNPMHKMYVKKRHIDVLTHFTRDLSREWWLKTTKWFYPLSSTAPSTASTFHFCPHILVRNLLT